VAGGAQIRWTPELGWSIIALFVVLALGAGILLWLRNWRQRLTADQPESDCRLDHFRTLFAQGQLTQEELDKIEHLLAEPPAPNPEEKDPPATASR
jgi:hypothetical protein